MVKRALSLRLFVGKTLICCGFIAVEMRAVGYPLSEMWARHVYKPLYYYNKAVVSSKHFHLPWSEDLPRQGCYKYSGSLSLSQDIVLNAWKVKSTRSTHEFPLEITWQMVQGLRLEELQYLWFNGPPRWKSKSRRVQQSLIVGVDSKMCTFTNSSTVYPLPKLDLDRGGWRGGERSSCLR